MATRKHSRSDRSSDRAGGNRPRTHPAQSAAGRRSTLRPGRAGRWTPAALATLNDVRSRLELVASVVAVTSAALKSQAADSDYDAATTLQRCVCDVLAVQIERLDRLCRRTP
jgi:hypothetical protein